jgi:DNA-binding NarL/FixJ family response regulator
MGVALALLELYTGWVIKKECGPVEAKAAWAGGRVPSASSAPIRVAIVEDDRVLRETIASFIEKADGFSCVGSYGKGEDALAEVPRAKPDVVLMDIGLPGLSGIDCARALKRSVPQTQIVMHTVYDEGDFLFEALRSGASGYLLKRTTGTRLLDALREACQGGMPFTRQMAEQVQVYFRQLGRNMHELDLLAPREAETLRHLAEGLLYKQIADRMGISLETVRQYVKAIYTKLHVNSRTEAVVKYLRH